MTEPRWDDDRLRQAYRNRFGGPASPDLARAVIDDLPTRDRPADRRALALAAVVAIVATTVGVGMVLSPGPFISPPRQSTPPATFPNPTTGSSRGPTPSPRSAVSFPAEVHGLPVISVADALAQPREGIDGVIDTEFAVRGHFIVPPTSIACALPRPDIEPLPAIDRTCPEGLTWLMEDPERPWDLVDGVARWHRPIRPALYLLVGSDVPFDLPQLFRDTSEAEPRPVVVLGHFSGTISTTYRDAGDFVVDALVWRDGELSPNDTVIVGPRPGEDRAVVQARVDEAIGPARATWAAVISGRDAAGADAAPNGELVHASSVWKLTRLIDEAGRPVVRVAYTADGGHRVWGPGGLAPEQRIAVTGPGGSATSVAIVDDPDIVESIRIAGAQEPGAEAFRVMTRDVAVPLALSNPIGRPNDLRIRWTGTDCDEQWVIEISWDRQSIFVGPTRRDECQATGIDIDIVLTLSEPLPVGSLTESTGNGGVGG